MHIFIKRLFKNIYDSTICNRQNLESTQLPIKKEIMTKLQYIHNYNNSHENEWITNYYNWKY
jgi:hypothetical protein